MAVERVIIEIVGDTKQINSTITQLEKLGKVDKANAETFKKTNEEAQKGIKATGNSIGGLESQLNNLKGQIIGAFAIGSLVAFGKEAIQTAAKIDSITKSLEFITGGSKQATATMEYLKNLSNRLGLEFTSTAQAFKLFAGATTQSGMSLNQTKSIFESVSKAVTTMGLSSESAESVFRALSQIMSKGVLSAEELRQQLGEVLPGSFAIAARSMGKTEQVFNKLLETGGILSKDFLPNFAKQLEKDLAGGAENAAEGMQGSINRMMNMWTSFSTWFGSSFGRTFIDSLESIGDAVVYFARKADAALNGTKFNSEYYAKIQPIIDEITKLNVQAERFTKVEEFNAALEKLSVLSNTATPKGIELITEAMRELTKQRDSFVKGGGNGGKAILGDYAALQARLKDLKVEIQDILAAGKQVPVALVNEYANVSKKIEEIDAFFKKSVDKQLSAFDKLTKAAGDLENAMRDTLALNGIINPAAIAQLDDFKKQLEIIEINIKNLNRTDLKDLSGTKPTTTALGEAASGVHGGFDASQYEKDIAEMQKLSDDALSDLERIEKAKTAITQSESDKRLQIERDAAEQRKRIQDAAINAAFQMATMAFDYQYQAAMKQNQWEMGLNEDLYKKKKINETAYQKNKASLMTNQAQKEKEYAIFNATIGLAQGLVNVWSGQGDIYTKAALSFIVAALGATQIALIESTPPPKFAKGTDRVVGGEKGKDSVHAILMPDEAVITAEQNMKYPGMAKAWNDGKLDTYLTKKFMIPNMEAKSMKGLESNIFAENIAKSIRLNSEMGGVEFGLKKLNRTEQESAAMIVEAIQKQQRKSIW